MKIRVRVAIYGLLALTLLQALVMHQQDKALRQQQLLIRQLWRQYVALQSQKSV